MRDKSSYIAKILVERWWALAVIAALLVFVVSLALGREQSVWFDEGYSIMLAHESYGEILSLTGVDAHPPGYYFLLKAWGDTFGWSELALRSLSALFAAGAVGLLAVLIRKLFSREVALLALPVIALAPFWLRYGYEIRMYSLAGLVGVAASLVLFYAVQERTNKLLWVTYGALVALGMYVLYMTLALWVAHFAWLLWTRRKNLFKQPWVGAYVLSLVLFVPYLPTFIHQLTHSALPGVGSEINLNAVGNVVSMLTLYIPDWQLGKWSALLIFVYIGIIIAVWVKVRGTLSSKVKKSLQYASFLALGPLVFYVVYGLAASKPYFIVRYVAHVAPLLYALVAVVLAYGALKLAGRARAAVVLVVAVVLAAGVVNVAQAGNFVLERNQHPTGAEVRRDVDCSDTTVVADGAYEYIDNFYYYDGCDLRFYSTTHIDYNGGYAWLANHDDKRVLEPSDVTSKNIDVVYYPKQDGRPDFVPSAKYHLVSSQEYGSIKLDKYSLSAE